MTYDLTPGMWEESDFSGGEADSQNWQWEQWKSDHRRWHAKCKTDVGVAHMDVSIGQGATLIDLRAWNQKYQYEYFVPGDSTISQILRTAEDWANGILAGPPIDFADSNVEEIETVIEWKQMSDVVALNPMIIDAWEGHHNGLPRIRIHLLKNGQMRAWMFPPVRTSSAAFSVSWPPGGSPEATREGVLREVREDIIRATAELKADISQILGGEV